MARTLLIHGATACYSREFDTLEPEIRSKWVEWLVAQELFRRQCIAGTEDPEALWFWASNQHEIDFVDAQERLYEVKVGRTQSLTQGA